MIAAGDMTIAAPAVPSAPAAPAAAFRERVLLMVLFVTVLASSVAFIEPSPHDGLMGVLLVISLAAGVRFERLIVVPFALLLVWNVAGVISLMNVPAEEKAIQYTGTSIYLAIAALLFACLFARNTMPRLAAMRSAYTLTALCAVCAGAAGYFHLFPDAVDWFTDYGRAMGAFKDPNVYGPFLIWPALFLMQRMVAVRFRMRDAAVFSVLLFGLLLSFSRGAWFHFAVSGIVTLLFAFAAAPTQSQRMRIVSVSVTGVAFVAACVVVLLSFSSLHHMFEQRAELLQSYDVGSGGRFELQRQALSVVLEKPNGMGPFEFARVYGLQQHNVYLQAFIVYGWVGGVAYILLLLSTLWIGLRTSLIRAPWQPYLITAFAAFVGEVLEGFVIDTDHWRHFFLLLGMVWGLAAATLRSTPQPAPPGAFSYAGAG